MEPVETGFIGVVGPRAGNTAAPNVPAFRNAVQGLDQVCFLHKANRSRYWAEKHPTVI